MQCARRTATARAVRVLCCPAAEANPSSRRRWRALPRLRGKRVLYLVHRRELCGQIRRTFADWGVVMHLCDVMMVQTAARRLAGTATKAVRDAELSLSACSRIDTGSRGASHGGLAAPGLIITDENHHCLAASYRRIYDAFPDVPCVGVTATPQRLSGGGLGDVNDRLIEGVSAHWLIGHGYLAPYDYFAPSVTDLTGLRSSHGEYIASDIAARMNRQAIHGDVIAHWRRLADGRKTICYCASREHSRAVAAAYCAAGVRAAHLDGDTPERERTRTVEAFPARGNHGAVKRRPHFRGVRRAGLLVCGAAAALRSRSPYTYSSPCARCATGPENAP